jgi:hypothetical protein
LILRAEDEARQPGRTAAFVVTVRFQAPEFDERQA